MEKIIIIGGGIAGLASLNALLDKGINAILLEGSTIGTPKMCGEFIAPSAIHLLQHWNIGPLQIINQIQFNHTNKTLMIKLPQQGGAFARKEAEMQLAARARSKGGVIRENSSIESIVPHHNYSAYTITLQSGEKIVTQNAIVATGRMIKTHSNLIFKYYGIKAHADRIIDNNILYMHNVSGAYFGIVPISQTASNFACLVQRSVFEKAGSARQLFSALIRQNQNLQYIFQNSNVQAPQLLEASIPEFAFKKIPPWPNVFFIGDALASFPPAIGYGFSHSLDSAMLAVDFFLKNKPHEYTNRAQQQVKFKMRLGKLIHQLLLNPTYTYLTFPLFKTNEWLTTRLLQKMGYLSAGKIID